MNDLKIIISHHLQPVLIILPASLTFFPHSSSYLLPRPFLNFLPFCCLSGFICNYIPSLPLFNLIKENAIQLSFSWPIVFFFSTSYCYSLTLYGCQSGTQPMLFPGMDMVALAIMTFLLVSHSHRSAPEDTAPPFWMSPVILSCLVFLIIEALLRAVVIPAVNQCTEL